MKAVPLAIVMLAILGASMFVLVDSEESDAEDPVDITVTYNVNLGTAYIVNNTTGDRSQQLAPGVATVAATPGDSVTYYATPASGYEFKYWMRPGVSMHYQNNPYTITASSGGYVLTPIFEEIPVGPMELGLICTNGGSAYIRNNTTGTTSEILTDTGTTTLSVQYGDSISYYATPQTGNEFGYWVVPGTVGSTSTKFYDNPYTFTASTDFVLSAVFDIAPTGDVQWSNKNFNGKVDILFSFRPGTDHTVTADLYAGTVDDNGLTTWAPSGYKMEVTLSFTNTLHAEAKILRNGAVWSGHAGVSDPGAWSRVLLSLDSENGRITLTPVRSFTSFTSFSLYESQERVIIDWPETTTGTATSVITHEDDGNDHARFAVVASRPFLNSYGVILYNPTINVRDYFPQYDSVRLNLFSFALYGTSMTINGHTWPVTDGKVTVQYVDLGDNQHFTPDADPTSPVKSRTFSLSNIYITWDNGRAALTFVDNRFTLDLGDYPLNQETMSFVGLWYFTTMLYEPYTATEKTLSDWKPFPETSAQQMILIFMGITLVAGVAGMVHVRRTGRGTVDMVVIGGALLIAFIMLGAWYRCYLSSISRI